MEASVRLLASSAATAAAAGGLHRRQLHLYLHHSSLSLLNPNRNARPLTKLSLPKSSLRSNPFLSSPNPFSSLSRLFSPTDALILDSSEGASIQWDHANLGISGDRDPICTDRDSVMTVVLLGWLGARQKHLKKYAEMYNSRGVRSVRFVVPPKDLLGFDLGRRVEQRIGELANEIADWCSERERDGRERNLMFHTFSNTGWLVYGVILDNLRSRADVIKKIRGCIVDSAPCAEINPEVWAAGFCAAMLKKRNSINSVPQSKVEPIEGSELDVNFTNNYKIATKPSLHEMILMSVLRKFFEVTLRLPDVNRRLSKYISVLSKEQPPCPQLYLYSSADRVIPAKFIEEFIEDQIANKRIVHFHNFGLSPHVDHYRTYPKLYMAKIDEFLKLCCSAKV